MGEQDMLLRTIQDLEAIEHVPLAARLSVRSTYELIREAATQDPERTAIAFLSGGDRLSTATRAREISLFLSAHFLRAYF